MRAVWGLVFVVFIIACAVVYRAYVNRPVQLSADIFDHDAEDAAFRPGANQAPPAAGAEISLGLRPGLRMAKMVIPDRPHDPEELGKPPEDPGAAEESGFDRRRGFTISTNSEGLRIPDASQSDSAVYPAGSGSDFRIVCLGDSISFGWGVSYEESFPAALARELGLSVINASAPGARQEGLARWARQKLLGLRPDLIILTLRPEYLVERPVQDFKTVLAELADIAGDVPLVVVLPPLSTFDVQIALIKQLYPGPQSIDSDVQAIAASVAPIPVLGLTKTFRDAQRGYQASAARAVFATLVEEEGVQRLVGIQGQVIVEAAAPEQPTEAQVQPPRGPVEHIGPGHSPPGPPPGRGGPPPTVGPPTENASGMTELNSIMHAPDPAPERPLNRRMVIASEIYDAFETDGHLREPFFFDGAHPDKEGHALFGKSVAAWLIERGLVPDGSGPAPG